MIDPLKLVACSYDSYKIEGLLVLKWIGMPSFGQGLILIGVYLSFNIAQKLIEGHAWHHAGVE